MKQFNARELKNKAPLGIVIIVEIPKEKLGLAKADMALRAKDYGLRSVVLKEERGKVVHKSAKVTFAIIPLVKPASLLEYQVIESQIMEFQAIWQGNFVLENMDKEILAAAMEGQNSNNIEGMN